MKEIIILDISHPLWYNTVNLSKRFRVPNRNKLLIKVLSLIYKHYLDGYTRIKIAIEI
jgi:hypothetical protein